MFEAVELGRTLSKRAYKAREPKLRVALLEAQAELLEAPFPLLLLINGVEGAGKGETVNLLHEWMDPHYLDTCAFGEPSDEESERPGAWRFWRSLPARGRTGIFFGSWYTAPIVDRVYRRIKEPEFETQLAAIATLERELVADGVVLVKLWFHLSKDAQRKRLRALEKDRDTRWRVTKDDWKKFEDYDRFSRVSEHALRATSTGEAPWILVEGTDERWRSAFVAEQILERLRGALDAHAARSAPKGKARRATDKPAVAARAKAKGDPVTVLDSLDLGQKLTDRRYKQELEHWQGELAVAFRKFSSDGRSAIAVFEGWDAAGKGGAIRRITAAIDARQYQVIPIAAPTDEERAHHYLWRFWRHLPRAGRLTIFDRSWYGRVLVERVEGFASPAEWERGYGEIVDFEEQLAQHGIVVAKFWLHIDKAEQMRRLRERQKTDFKHFKVTAEDFRNREKWSDYELAANEMVERTSTEFAPWTLVEANDKAFARIKVLRTMAESLQAAL